ncbi:glucose 1-dehydrogenase [Halorubrum sp. CBA1125]|uniref:glucose 1-dehydrogenase n=1 Tax=Halorubrum sp. CBA1125 TaxID=2668072 RepID=UPI0012E8A679|nr:glucose 1-dehydrogenase [Halorubrum sp. CBA1125]MUW13393.1 glucose 1-dehydrogenase [Halorubrum sp. CBA1125]
MSTLDSFRLDGKTAIVTGGNRGIGRGISDSLAAAGANLVIANRDEAAGEAAAEEISDETGAEVRAVATDVTDDDDVEALVDATVEEFGSLDVLVNNAGRTLNIPAEEMTMEEWRKVMDLNLDAVFRCSRAAGREMIDSDGGSIINVSSISAFMANHPQPQVSYNASKAGVEGFKFQLASEWAEHGIRVNNINPGYVRTDLIDEVIEEDPEMVEEWRREMLLDEMARPEDIGPLAVFLASDASWYMTGESVVIDGGYLVR